ncbi:uncharacterized protein N7482_002737 [Penicillium canariense]|uniref:Uncharacterized protein n=1 Tax=Penicillium canariense TaxID=189055 RepID=A0A9W9IJD4_9EURO|nr:uncharacterized protein N7482_002737 [Penicillium canariense]KAJ5176860.1 hypothetical protein N7482_002737 [Penicillium canariense]
MNKQDLKRDEPDDQQIFDDPEYTTDESNTPTPSPTQTSTQTPTSPVGVPPDPTPTSQMVFVYEWIDTPAKLQYWQIMHLPVGRPLDWCGGDDLQYMVAAQSIKGTDVPKPIPFPSDMEFSKIDYGGQQLGFKDCVYKGNPDAPGTFECPNFHAPVQCGKTPNVGQLITCPATSNMAKSWAVSMAICQWGKSNVKG